MFSGILGGITSLLLLLLIIAALAGAAYGIVKWVRYRFQDPNAVDEYAHLSRDMIPITIAKSGEVLPAKEGEETTQAPAPKTEDAEGTTEDAKEVESENAPVAEETTKESEESAPESEEAVAETAPEVEEIEEETAVEVKEIEEVEEVVEEEPDDFILFEITHLQSDVVISDLPQ